MQTTLESIREQYYRASEPAVNLSFLAQTAARCYTGWVFLASGLTKLKDWETTLFLFEYEYSVPLLSPEFAAYLATIAVLSLEDIPTAALYLHYIWGILLAQIVVWGGGTLSLDWWFNRRRKV